MNESEEIVENTESKKLGRPKNANVTVTLKKAAFVDGVLIGNQGGKVDVSPQVYKSLKAARLIDEVF